MIAIIRIKGQVGVPHDIKRTLEILKLRKKHICVLASLTPELKGMLKKVENYVAFGEINKETMKQLIIKRGKAPGDKPLQINDDELNKLIESISEGKTKLKDNKNIKPFFRLHPPKGGFKKKIKKIWPNGILGDNKEEINNLILKML